MPDQDPEDEAEEIINESDEGLSDLIEDTEVYDETDEDSEDVGYDDDDGDPQELNFESDIEAANEETEPAED